MDFNRLRIVGAILAGLSAGGDAALAGPTVEEKCSADKAKVAGKYSSCRLKAEAKAIRTGNPADFDRCDEKLLAKWDKAEQLAERRGGACVDTFTGFDIQSLLIDQTGVVTGVISAGSFCGDGILQFGEFCDGSNFNGESCESLGFAGGFLTCDFSCSFDVSGCFSECGGSQFPATGQMYNFGAGSDGDVRAGAVLSYVDNGDGTITDTNTGLMWEKKIKDSDSESVHEVDRQFDWCAVSGGGTCQSASQWMNGSITSTFLATLNDTANGGQNCFAGYCDWRIPNVKELLSIVTYQNAAPAVSGEFSTPSCTGCTDITSTSCSCTALERYWTSTTPMTHFGGAFYVDFHTGEVIVAAKQLPLRVRAVRGGL